MTPADESPTAFRARMRALLAPIVDQPGFEEECRRQSLLVAEADAEDDDLMRFLDAALADMASEW